MSDFRASLYEDYAWIMQDAGATLDMQAARRWGRAYDHYLRGWLPADKGAAIADLACGRGQLLLFFKDRGFKRLSGVDISPTQIHLAKQAVECATEQDAHSFLAEQPDTFDLITGLDIIEHLGKDEALRLLEACYRALRPGGRMVLQTPNLDSPMSSSIRYGDFTHEIGLTPDCLGRLMRMTGFTEITPRELGPIARGYSLKSSLRHVAWRALRLLVKLYNLVETGTAGSGVYTRVFLISGRKP